MRQGQVLVARLKTGATIVRYLEGTTPQVSVSMSRNRQARVPTNRIIMTTGIVAPGQEELEEFRRKCQALSPTIDLSEVWETLGEESAPITLESLAELYWGPHPEPSHKVALLLHLEQGSDYIVRGSDGYTARSRASVHEIHARRRRETENAQAAEALMHSLAQGRVPRPLTNNQKSLLQHLRSYAVYGEDYPQRQTPRTVLATVSQGKRDLQELCFELLVGAGVFSPDEPLELHRTGIRREFPEDALAEAATLSPSESLAGPQRNDLTHLSVITIDDAETEERDDALSLEMVVSGPDTETHSHRIGIHIADAGALIPPGSAMDREADQRMATLYLPEGKIEMLPPDFSRRLGSLEPGERRLVMSVLVQVDATGEVLEWEVTPSVIKSSAALTYAQADQILKDKTSPWQETLVGLHHTAQELRRRREGAGAINIDRPEMAIKVRPSGQVEVKVVQRSSPARKLVTELMILCNSLLAEFCRSRGLPAVYRTQAAPPNPPQVTEDLQKASEGPLMRHLVMRLLPSADLDTVPGPHWSLGVPAYIQATSPLRRYPDLAMQRQISRFLNSGKPLYPTEEVASVVQRAEVQMRELARLEESRKRYWFLKYLQQSRLEGKDSAHPLDLFTALVLENDPRRTPLLELTEFPFLVRTKLPETCTPGETVTLRLHDIDLWRRTGQFTHARDIQPY